jgi:hypothetical protein
VGRYQAEVEQLMITGKRENHSMVSYSKRKLNDALFEVARLERELALVTHVLDSQERIKLTELITIDKQAIEMQRKAIQDYYSLGLADDHIKIKMVRENIARSMAQLQQWQQRLAR